MGKNFIRNVNNRVNGMARAKERSLRSNEAYVRIYATGSKGEER